MQIYLPVGFIENGKFALEQSDARIDTFEKTGLEPRLQIQMQAGLGEDALEVVAKYLNGVVSEPVLFHDRHGYISEAKIGTILSDLEIIAHFQDLIKQPVIVTYHGPMMFASWEEAILAHRKKGLPYVASASTAPEILDAKEKSLDLLRKIKEMADKSGIEVLLENVPGLDYVHKPSAKTRDKRWKGTGWLPKLIDLGALYVTAEDLNYAFENLGIASAVDIEHLVFTYGEKHSETAIRELRSVRVAHAGAGNKKIVNERIGSHLPFIKGYDGKKPLVDWGYVDETFPRYLRALMDKGVEFLVHEHYLGVGVYSGKAYVEPTVESIRNLGDLIPKSEKTF